MISDKDKAALVFSKLGDQQDTVAALMQPDFVSVLMDTRVELSASEELAILEEVVSKLNAPEDTSLFNMDDTSFVHTDNISDQNDGGFEETQISSSSESLSDRYHSPDKIARSLMTQNLQVISFFLHRLDDEALKSDIIRHLDPSIMQQLETVVVEETPIADKIYQRLYECLCLKREDADEDEDDEGFRNDDDFFEESQLDGKQDQVSTDDVASVFDGSLFSGENMSTRPFGGLFS